MYLLFNPWYFLTVLMTFSFINEQFNLAISVNQKFSGLRRTGRQLKAENVDSQFSLIDLIPCASMCMSTTNCRTFSWNQQERKCLLSSTDVTHDHNSNVALSEDASWNTMSLLEYTAFTLDSTSMNFKMASFEECIEYAKTHSGLGFEGKMLKEKQLEVLNSLYKGNDCIAVLPTGYGKSIIFQLLPWFFQKKFNQPEPSIVIVVSPLNSLMQNQILKLRRTNIKACSIDIVGACIKLQVCSIQEARKELEKYW